MALFSRRKKNDDTPAEDPEVEESSAVAPEDAHVTEQEAPVDAAPEVSISMQSFRGLGAQGGPTVPLPEGEAEVALPKREEPVLPRGTVIPGAVQGARTLPLAPTLPPEQTETVPGMKDNVLLRNALGELGEGPTNEQLIGVLRQALQGHLYLRVHGDARQQISEGKPLSISVIRDGERSFMLAFSSAKAVRDSVQKEKDSPSSSAIAQPVTAVFQQVIDGGFAGVVLDNASAPHRAVFPVEIVKRAMEQADSAMTVKALLAAPREADTTAKVGQALVGTQMWVAVNEGAEGKMGVSEARTADGRRFLQLFSHPLEIVALGRSDRSVPFTPAQLAKVLNEHSEMAGVIVDAAGPSIMLEREALAPVIALETE